MATPEIFLGEIQNGGGYSHPPRRSPFGYSMMSTVTRIFFALDANFFANVMNGIVSSSSIASKITQQKTGSTGWPDGTNIRVSEIPIVSKSWMDSHSMSVVPHSGHRSASSAMISVVHFRFLHFITYRIDITSPHASCIMVP